MTPEEQTLRCITWNHHNRNVWCSNPCCPKKLFRFTHLGDELYNKLAAQLQTGKSLAQALANMEWQLQRFSSAVATAGYQHRALSK